MKPRSSFPFLLFLFFAVTSLLTLKSIDQQFGVNQALFFIASISAFTFVSSFSYSLIRSGRWVWFGIIIGLLLLTFAVGKATNGSVSWLRLGAYRLQASEFLKPALILVLAALPKKLDPHTKKGLLAWSGIAGMPLLLVLLQPDFGTAMIILGGAGALYLETKPPKWHLLTLFLSGLVIAITAWIFLLKPYQKDRILTFVRPTHDPQGSGYNAQQAMIAVGSGGIFGTGFGKGAQSHLRFLPERQTDFLFATYAEETGFVGSSFLVILYVLIFVFILQTKQSTTKAEEKRVLTGIFALLFIQTLINIGMNIGIMPITGVPLPFFSLGGSSLAASSISLGIAESIRRSQVNV